MILSETVLFFLTIVGCCAILFILIYYIIILSDLECDYLNAHECCEKLNYWLLYKYLAHVIIILLLLFHGELVLFLMNLPMSVWLTYDLLTVPQGSLGAYDPAEIYNRGQLRKHMKHVLINVAYYLFFAFIYIYCVILALLKGNPVSKADYDIVTEI